MPKQADDELEARLVAWAREYGLGGDAGLGWKSRNILQTLVDHRGFVPDSRGYVPVPIRTAADEVETIVRGMEASGWVKQAQALRVDYFHPRAAIDSRLSIMRRRGLPMSRAGYYDHIAQAKAFVAGALFRRHAPLEAGPVQDT